MTPWRPECGMEPRQVPSGSRTWGIERRGANPALDGSNADEHLHELAGSSSLWIYLTPNRRIKGYEELKRKVEVSGCTIGSAEDD
jgi:hypothetical protein